MNHFLRKSILFLSPLIAISLSLELAVRYSDNTFIKKADFIANNKDIELLILGSSHNQGINVNHLSKHSANLAYGMQDIQLDSALFFSKINQLTKLKYLVLEYDYISLFKVNYNDYFRYGWYSIYHDINLTDLKGINNYSLYISSPKFFNNHIISKLKSKKETPVHKFEKLNYDEKKIEKKSANRMLKMNKSISKDNFNFNSPKLESMIKYCQKKNITVILISNPMYKKYIAGYNADLNYIRAKYLKKLKLKYPNLVHLDFEKSNLFNVRDYKDEDHLNRDALIKYTQLINVRLDSLEQLNSLH